MFERSFGALMNALLITMLIKSLYFSSLHLFLTQNLYNFDKL